MATATFNLLGLPIELTCHISAYISTKDLGNLRLTCRAVEKILFDLFATEFFSTRQIFQHPISLQNLVDISKHAQFSKAVRKVIFCDDRLIVTNAISKTAEKFYLDQKHCIESGETRRLLAMALQDLPNCHTLEQRDFISPRQRCRDGTVWRSYGVKFIQQSCPDDIQCHPRLRNMLQQNTASCLLGAVVDASTQGFRIENLHCINQSPTWDQHTFFVPLYLELSYCTTFKYLKSLMLSIALSGAELNSTPHNFSKFLEMLPDLEHLRVNLDDRHYNTEGPQDKIIECISNKALRLLELGKMSIGLTSFKRLLQSQRETLEKLTFFRVALCPSSVAGDETPTREGPSIWHQAINPLQDMPMLRSITFNNIYGSSTEPVVIKDTNGIHLRTYTIQEDTTAKMIERLEALDTNLCQTTPEYALNSSGESGEEDSDDDDDFDQIDDFEEMQILEQLEEVDEEDDSDMTAD